MLLNTPAHANKDDTCKKNTHGILNLLKCENVGVASMEQI